MIPRAELRNIPSLDLEVRRNFWLSRFVQVSGFLITVIGLTVFMAWFAHLEALIRIFPVSAPMRMNAALGAIAFGIALLNLQRGRQSIVQFSSAFLVIIGGLTSLEYLLDLNFHIDEMLIQDYMVTELELYPGRMAASTAINFALSGGSLLMFSSHRMTYPSVMCAAVIMAHGLASIIIYALRIEAVYTLQNYAAMAIHTALLFIVGGAAIIAAHWSRQNFFLPSWLAATLGLTALSVALVLWQAATVQVRVGVTAILESTSALSQQNLLILMNEYLLAFSRMAERERARQVDSASSDWAADASNYVEDLIGLQQVAWVDAEGNVQMVISEAGATPVENINLNSVEVEQRSLVRAATNGRSAFSSDQTLVMVVSIGRDQELIGYIRAEFDAARLIEAEFSTQIADGYGINVSAHNAIIYSSTSASPMVSESVRTLLALDDVAWTLQVHMTSRLLSKYQSNFGAAVLAIGALLSLLLTSLTRLYIVAHQRQQALIDQQHELTASKTRFSNALEYAAIGMALVDLSGNWLKVNASACAIVGYSEAELLGMSFQDITHQDDLDLDLQNVADLLAGKQNSYQMEKRYIRRDGSVVWVRLAVSLARSATGAPEFFISQIEDIDRRKQAEDALRESELRFRAIAETANDALVSTTFDGFIAYVNPAAERIFGYTSDSLLGMHASTLVSERTRKRVTRTLHRALESTENNFAGFFHLDGLRAGGKSFPLDMSLAVWTLQGKKYVTAIIRDISERLRTEEARRISSALQTAILGSTNLSVIATDTAGLITLFNRAATRMLGYRSEELIGKSTPAVFHDPGEVVKYAEQLSLETGKKITPGFEVFVHKARTQEADEREWTYINKSGKRIPVILSVTAIRDDRNVVRGFLGVASDISDRKDQAARLKVALAERETLFKEVYHRVKNNLQVIRSLMNLQSQSVPEGLAREALRETSARVQAMALVHEQLYQSGDLSALRLKSYMSQLLEQMWVSANARARGIELIVDVDDVTAGLEFTVPLGLLVNELVSNALKHAFPNERNGEVRVRFKLNANHGAVLEVSDNGVGLNVGEEILAYPSMGLKLVTSLASQLEGSLEVHNAAGTTILVRLPAFRQVD